MALALVLLAAGLVAAEPVRASAGGRDRAAAADAPGATDARPHVVRDALGRTRLVGARAGHRLA
ncbi:MAG: hypothetical protein ACRDWY_16810, partial [Actinomycetes bacterium]